MLVCVESLTTIVLFRHHSTAELPRPDDRSLPRPYHGESDRGRTPYSATALLFPKDVGGPPLIKVNKEVFGADMAGAAQASDEWMRKRVMSRRRGLP